MNYETFLTQIEQTLKSYLKKADNNGIVSVKKVLKNNGIELDAITLVDMQHNASPTIYLKSYYEEFKNGRSIEDIVSDIYSLIKKNQGRLDVNIDDFKDFEKIKGRIAYKVINAERNKKLLKTVPHIKVLDLALVFYCIIQCSVNESATTLIHDQHLKLWNVDFETVKNEALKNTPILLPCEIKSMNDIITEMFMEGEVVGEDSQYSGQDIEQLTNQLMEELSISDDVPQMYVLTNRFKLNGASAMFYEDVLKNFAMEHESDLIVLPSSIHEIIMIPAQNDMKAADFESMIREVNCDEVDPSEILSGHAYIYDRKENRIKMP